MSSWRDQILIEFTPKVARLTLVADPDGLLLEEGILAGIRERGFELIPFDDPVAFRYAYESRFRSRWDHGEHTDLVVVLRSQTSDLDGLPYDLLQAGRRLSFNLGDIFPNLSYPVVAALDRGDLDALYEAQKRHAPGRLGDNATKEFVLCHVFEIALELIKKPSDLLHALLRRHYRLQRIPATIDERFIDLMRHRHQFDEWPLEILVSDREAFFAFLQERWPIFLNREADKVTSDLTAKSSALAGIHKDDNPYTRIATNTAQSSALSIKGPIDLPFDHHDVRVYIDNLFTEGLLYPVPHDHANRLSRSWIGIGIRTAATEDKLRRVSKLLESLHASIPSEDAKYTEWFRFARSWAELIVLTNEHSDTVAAEHEKNAETLQFQVYTSFSGWLLKRFSGLINLPPVPPVMLHHIPRFLARQTDADRNTKVALVMVDGLAMDQWLVIRNALSLKKNDFRFHDQAVFAWIPTLTSFSRQAAFAGKAPIFFPNSIHTTDKEPALWVQFWTDQGFTANEVVYIKGLGDDDLVLVSETLSHPKVRVVGLVVDKVDKIMHGMEMGTAGMHNQVRQWAQQGYLNALFNLLLDHNFEIYLTSDHGNLEATGCGRPTEGAVADLRGERVRIYANELLRLRIQNNFPNAIEWPGIGLPENIYPLIAPHRKAFVGMKERVVTHGGCSLEELIVPLVHIERKK